MTKTSDLIRAELNLEKGSGAPGKEFVADMTLSQALNVADKKKPELLARSRKAALQEIVGVCVTMGIKVNGRRPETAARLISEGKWDKDIAN